MNTYRFIFLATSALVAAALACNAPGAPTPSPAGEVETAVTETLTAIAPTEAAEPSAETPAPLEPTIPPEATSPPEPTAPSEPTGEPAADTPTPAAALPMLRVAFVMDGNVWLWTEGSAAIPLTMDGGATDVYLSDDGAIVAFKRSFDFTHYELWAVNSDGSNERRLVSLDDFAALLDIPDALSVAPHRVAWAPGTHTLAYSTRPTFEGPGLLLNYDLRHVDADTLQQSILFAPGTAGEFFYSPDGSQIAITTANSISLINADGSNLRPDVLTYEPVITYSEYLYHAQPIWAADSNSLRVMIPPMDPLAEPAQETTVWHIPTDGSPATLLSSFIAAPFWFAFQTAAPIAPYLSRLAYLTEVGDPADNVRELHIANADGSNDVAYAAGQQLEFLGWVPDTNRFAFSIANAPPQAGKVGSVPVQLTDVGNIRTITWVDAAQFVFVSGTWADWELRLGTPDGPSTLLAAITDDGLPTFDVDR